MLFILTFSALSIRYFFRAVNHLCVCYETLYHNSTTKFNQFTYTCNFKTFSSTRHFLKKPYWQAYIRSVYLIHNLIVNFVLRKRSNLYWLPKHRMKIRTEAICTYFCGVFLFVLRDTDGKSPFLCSSEVRTFLFFMHLENSMTDWKWYDVAMIRARQRCGEIPGQELFQMKRQEISRKLLTKEQMFFIIVNW